LYIDFTAPGCQNVYIGLFFAVYFEKFINAIIEEKTGDKKTSKKRCENKKNNNNLTGRTKEK
jgi:hypothetical protein